MRLELSCPLDVTFVPHSSYQAPYWGCVLNPSLLRGVLLGYWDPRGHSRPVPGFLLQPSDHTPLSLPEAPQHPVFSLLTGGLPD